MGEEAVRFPGNQYMLGYCSHLSIKVWRTTGNSYLAQFYLSVGDGGEDEKEGADPNDEPIADEAEDTKKDRSATKFLGQIPFEDLDKFFTEIIDHVEATRVHSAKKKKESE